MIIKEYVGSLNIVDEEKLKKVKARKDKLKQYEEAVKNGSIKKKDSEKKQEHK